MKRYPFDKRTVVVYWLLLLLPTVIVGISAFRLLSHEQERIDQQFRSSVMDRLNAVAESIRITVSGTQHGLMEMLAGIQGTSPADSLEQWKRTDPLVRNVFIWSPSHGLLLPRMTGHISLEDHQFIARYESLFAKRTPWRISGGEFDSSMNIPSGPGAAQGASPGSAGTSGISGSERLSSLKIGSAGVRETTTPQMQNGWVPWFSENKLFLLGWVSRDPKTGPFIGVEIEMVSLIAQIIPLMPHNASEGLVYCLLDGEGRVLHQSGEHMLSDGEQPSIVVSLAPSLPHWQVAAYFVPGGPASGAAHRSFVLITGLLLAIFVVAIIAGGSMLFRHAHRNMVDSLQKTTFVSNVSHELKTPLTNIRMYAELLKSGRIAEPEKREKYLDVVVSESERLTRLVNNVLDFSRLEQGRKKYRPEELDLINVVRELIDTQRLRLSDSGVRLDIIQPTERIFTYFDRDALEQVMLNLIDNAVKYGCGRLSSSEAWLQYSTEYGRSGEGQIIPSEPMNQETTAEQSDGPHCEITIAMAGGPDFAEIRIMDRGPGVPDGHQEQIFEKFHRVDDSITACRPGCGLGLSISRRLVRDLGGNLTYEPREGGGSVFIVRVPGRKTS